MEKGLHKVTDFLRNTIAGKTVYRILFQWVLVHHHKYIQGKVLDIGAGLKPSYLPYLPKNIEYLQTNYQPGEGVAVLDFNSPFPYSDNSINTVLLFHNLYIAKDPLFVVREAKRVLTQGGHVLIATPFVANEMPEPHDFGRWTKEGLDAIISSAGLSRVSVVRIGERFTAIAYILHPLLFIWPIRLIINTIAIALDACIPNKIRTNYPFPIGYFYVAAK